MPVSLKKMWDERDVSEALGVVQEWLLSAEQPYLTLAKMAYLGFDGSKKQGRQV